MLGYVPRCIFMVFASPPAERAHELHHWYDEIHGPDAIENGSFNALSRYRCVSNTAAPFLALWEGEWESDHATWEYITPRANALRAAGRIGDIPSASFATTTFVHPELSVTSQQPVRSLTMVQSDWWFGDGDRTASEWLAGLDIDNRTYHSRSVYSSDPLSPSPGLHVAFFEHDEPVAPAVVTGAAGPSPTRPFRSRFEDHDPSRPERTISAPATRGLVYVSVWEPIGKRL